MCIVKVAVVSTYDISGGAALAAYRLLKGLARSGTQARMLVQKRRSHHPGTAEDDTSFGQIKALARPFLDNLPLYMYRSRTDALFSTNWVPSTIGKRIKDWGPDLIHLHWVARGFLNPSTLGTFRAPLVWTLHDMWPITGGCHYNDGCNLYQTSCGPCPVLGSIQRFDLSRLNFRRKQRAYQGINPIVVSPSNWLADCARASDLTGNMDIRVIPYGIDTATFWPHPTQWCRQLWGLPEDKHVILFGAANATGDMRKGYDLLVSALQHACKGIGHNDVVAAVFGAYEPPDGSELPIPTRYLGDLGDDVSLSTLYAACDVFVAPSRQDNLPNTLIESLACGTPCVAFNTGGIPDVVEHRVTGYLAEPFDPEELAHGIYWCMEERERLKTLSENARRKAVRDYELQSVTNRYLDVYREVTERSRAASSTG